jgi:hypothetical protein
MGQDFDCIPGPALHPHARSHRGIGDAGPVPLPSPASRAKGRDRAWIRDRSRLGSARFWVNLAALLLVVSSPAACSHGPAAAHAPSAAHPRLSIPLPTPQPVAQDRRAATEAKASEDPEQSEDPEESCAKKDDAPETARCDRLEGKSLGTPALTLSRAMSGVEALDYTILRLDDSALRFVADKHPSLFRRLMDTGAGSCTISVGTEDNPAGKGAKVRLVTRAQSGLALSACARDLRLVLQYARGDLKVKPEKPPDHRRLGTAFSPPP